MAAVDVLPARGSVAFLSTGNVMLILWAGRNTVGLVEPVLPVTSPESGYTQ